MTDIWTVHIPEPRRGRTYAETTGLIERTGVQILLALIGLLLVITSILAHNAHHHEIPSTPSTPTTDVTTG